jgi:hypothetical protein
MRTIANTPDAIIAATDEICDEIHELTAQLGLNHGATSLVFAYTLVCIVRADVDHDCRWASVIASEASDNARSLATLADGSIGRVGTLYRALEYVRKARATALELSA